MVPPEQLAGLKMLRITHPAFACMTGRPDMPERFTRVTTPRRPGPDTPQP